jgi:hypothetical protein
MKTGKNYVDVWVQHDVDFETIYDVYVAWEYDPHGGNEVTPYWFDCWVEDYPGFADDELKAKIDAELKKMDIDFIMKTD